MGTDPGPGLPRTSPCEYLHRALLWEPVTQSLALVPSLSCDIRQIKAPLSKLMFALFLCWEPVSGPALPVSDAGRELTAGTWALL